MVISWKSGDTITADKLNGMQLTFVNSNISTGDATDAIEGALTLDNNGDLYQSTSGKQALLVSLKGLTGDKGEKGDTGAAGKDGLSVKSGTLNEDKNGVLTGATLKMSDDSTIDLPINKATA